MESTALSPFMRLPHQVISRLALVTCADGWGQRDEIKPKRALLFLLRLLGNKALKNAADEARDWLVVPTLKSAVVFSDGVTLERLLERGCDESTMGAALVAAAVLDKAWAVVQLLAAGAPVEATDPGVSRLHRSRTGT